jgi:hypothetical protein
MQRAKSIRKRTHISETKPTLFQKNLTRNTEFRKYAFRLIWFFIRLQMFPKITRPNGYKNRGKGFDLLRFCQN